MTGYRRISRRENPTAAVSRRNFITTIAAGASAIAVSGRVASAQAADVIKVGFVTPRTGALAAFGEPDPFVLELARKTLADGLSASGKNYKVEILDRDTQSDPSRASQLTKSLINSDATSC
jgi:branched-chain amino acid transport system substrate-binding protein